MRRAVLVVVVSVLALLVGCGKDKTTGPGVDPNALMVGTYVGRVYRIQSGPNSYTYSLTVTISALAGGYDIQVSVKGTAQSSYIVYMANPTVRFFIQGEQAPLGQPLSYQRGVIEGTLNGNTLVGSWNTASYAGFTTAFTGYWEASR